VNTRTLCTLLLALAAGSVAAAQTRATASSNLWIGIAFQDRSLEPVAALVKARWWFDDQDQAPEQHVELRERIGRVPAEWLPLGTRLPAGWNVHMRNGRTARAHTSGPLKKDAIYDEHLRIATDGPHLDKPSDRDLDVWEPIGIAVSGAVDVRTFSHTVGRKKEDARRFLEPAMLRAEQAAITRKQSAGDETSAPFMTVTDRKLRTAKRRFEHDLASTQADGSVVYYVEGGKTYGESTDCGTRARAAAIEDGAGTWKILDVQARTYCDLYVNHEPLAVLERDGSRCWLTLRQYEDGVEFALTQSKHLSFGEEPSNCRLK
jgi:hypothetical protein